MEQFRGLWFSRLNALTGEIARGKASPKRHVQEFRKEGLMKSAIRALFGVVAGMILAIVLIVIVEWLSGIVHPLPANFNGNMPEHVRRYPHWVLGLVVLAWGATSTASTWVASRVGGRLAGCIVALLLAWGLVFNLTKLPYTLWFKIVMLIAFPIACFLGIRHSRQTSVRP